MKRTVFVVFAALLAGAALFAACGLNGNGVKMTFDNETDSLLCFNLSSAAAVGGESCGEIDPNDTTVWRPGCDDAGKQPITVVLSLGRGGPEVYNRTATCDEWKASGAEFTIEQADGEFIVTDSLPG